MLQFFGTGMGTSFHFRLVNDPFSDPGLFVYFQYERQALLFDVGDLRALAPRDLLKIGYVFVTHAHMDHFIGFDQLVRILLGREKALHVFGPPDFFCRVQARLKGYTWNLVDEYEHNFDIHAYEIHPDHMVERVYPCRERFEQRPGERVMPFSGIVSRQRSFQVEAAILDHRIPCLGFSLLEHFSVNIIKEALSKLKLPVGPWLTRFKQALYEEKDPGTEFIVTWKGTTGKMEEKNFLLGELAREIAVITPGRKITYVTDFAGSPENMKKVLELARGADHLFIEASFMDRDRDAARKRYHITAKQAGELARRAGVKQFTPFHFSPRYSDLAAEVEKEARDAFTGSAALSMEQGQGADDSSQ